MSVPRVAIVGRPNVGKSTLFNRLSGSRIAITDHTPGVTRDSVESLVRIEPFSCLLVDTGGYVEGNEGFDGLVRERSLAEAARADLILFLLDVTDRTAADEDVAEILRRFADRVVVVVNKVDSTKRELLLAEFYELGFPHLVSVSAAHGLGMEDLREIIAGQLHQQGHLPDEQSNDAGAVEDTDDDYPIKIAILGKPNTGKSTLTNRLLAEERSIVSDVAGTTRDIVTGFFEFKGNRFTVMDTAGIRRKRSVNDSVEYYSVNRAVQAAEDCDVAVLVVDAVEGLAEQEKKIAQVIIRRGKSIVIALNKWDRLKDVPNMLQAVQDRIAFVFPILSFAPVIPISALDGDGVPRLLDMIAHVHSESCRRIDTGLLNRKLTEWVDRTPPPVVGRGRLKFRYITQVGVQPPTFVVFVNREHGIPEQYTRYIINAIRRDFDFTHVPVRLELRTRRS